MDRTDPVLFGLSYDYVGDLSETVALMWPKAEMPGHNSPPPPTLGEVVTTLRTLGKTELPKQLARWLDEACALPVVVACDGERLIGQLIDVHITQAYPHSLRAEVVVQ